MAEDLKHLLDAIQKEGIDKAERESKKIISDAERRAQTILHDAKRQSEEILAKAEQDASAFRDRGTRELEQAARDVAISLVRRIEDLLRGIVKESVSETLAPETLKEILVRISEIYFEKSMSDKPMDLYLNEEDASMLSDFFRGKLRAMMEKGLVIHTTDRIGKGFQVSLRNEDFYHDFTQEAITEELCRFLQPQIQKIIRSI